LLAVVLMTAFAGDIRRVLWVAVLPGIVAVVLLATAVREPPDTPVRTARLPITREGLSRLGAPFWRLAAIGGLVALARFSEAFLVLRASERGLSTAWVPMVLVVMSVAYAASAYPAGWLSDRMPRARLLAAGMFALVLGDVLLARDGGIGLAFAGIAAWGLHMGLTQGILASLVVDRVPATYRATAFGMFNLVSGVALLVASGAAGALWQAAGPSAAFQAGAGMAALAGVAALLAREHSSPVDPVHGASP
jgi:predicted MFS family arabinose efflux permease